MHIALADYPEQGTAFIHEGGQFSWDKVNHDNHLYKLVNITVFAYFINPQITPSFLRLTGTFGLEGSHTAEEISYFFTTSEKLFVSGLDLIAFLINCWMSLYCQYSGLGLFFSKPAKIWSLLTSCSFATQI